MKWLLITNTLNRNPGDEWIRIGVQRLIRDVDKCPEFIIRNKEFVEDQDAETEFDRAVWCGSPLFWSHKTQGCWENYWWDKWMHGWLFKDKRKVLILGVGNALGREIHDKTSYEASIQLVKSKCWRLVTRQKISDDPEILVSCCPSVFALAGDNTKKTKKVCNLMPDGAHEAFFSEEESTVWRTKVSELSSLLNENGFEVVCHAQFEEDFVKSLGWMNGRTHLKPATAEGYFPIYSQAQLYIGNRIHGAMLTIGAGGVALAIGYDSRLGMVEYANGTVLRPSEVDKSRIEKWINSSHEVYDWRPEYAKQLSIMRQFAEA